MTTIVRVKPSEHACLVTIYSNYRSPAGLSSSRHDDHLMLAPYEKGERVKGVPEWQEFTVTTTQTLTVTDLEHDDPRIREAKGLPPLAKPPAVLTSAQGSRSTAPLDDPNPL